MRVCTINLGSKDDWRIRRALKRRAQDADIITVQEAGDREKVLLEVCGELRWTLLREDGDGKGKIAALLSPVAVAEGLGWGYHPCTPRTFVGAEGAGPEWISPKHVLAANLGDVTVATTHLVPSVQREPFPGRTKRRELYRQHIAAIVEWAATVPHPIVLTGDFNATPDYPQLDPLREAGFRCHTVPSFGVRPIDHIWVRGCTTDAVEALPFPSDHKAVAATIAIPEVPVVTQRRLTELADVLRAAGLKVVEIDGWKTRSRPESTGGFNPVGVLWHHTGAFDGLTDAQSDREYAAWLAKVGRSDLPAPLCQVSISAEGVVYVCAAGRANHAGEAKASGSVAAGDGNSLYVGVECMNSGKQGWPPSQYEAMVKAGAALGKYLDCTVNAQRGHKETSLTGKWDPGMLDMEKFRADIAAAMKPPRRSPRWGDLWEALDRAHDLADAIAQDRPVGTPAGDAARAIRRAARINRTLAAEHSTEH